jgi:hypothetical protein
MVGMKYARKGQPVLPLYHPAIGVEEWGEEGEQRVNGVANDK